MPRGIYEVQFVSFSLLIHVRQVDCLALYGDAALPLYIHVVKDLVTELPGVYQLCVLDKTVGKGRFTVVDMGDDTEIPDMFHISVCILEISRTGRCSKYHLELTSGSRPGAFSPSSPDLPATMRRSMLRVFPQLHDVRVTHAWGGFVDITMNRAPDFGRLAPDVLYLQGFSGHGLALTGLAGQLAAEAIRGQAQRFDLFARLRHRPFPGGDLLRTPLLVLAMAWFRLRDAL